MQNPEIILGILEKKAKKEDYVFKDLYKILYNKEIYLNAYGRMYSKQGNMTKGTDGKTIDGFSERFIDDVILSLRNESYKPNPVKRVYIPKQNGKKRPLGIPSFIDKLVQEVIRGILDTIYEQSFSDLPHGFRPKRSCQTALNKIIKKSTGVKWWIEGDIEGFFDNIDHNKLTDILKKK